MVAKPVDRSVIVRGVIYVTLFSHTFLIAVMTYG